MTTSYRGECTLIAPHVKPFEEAVASTTTASLGQMYCPFPFQSITVGMPILQGVILEPRAHFRVTESISTAEIRSRTTDGDLPTTTSTWLCSVRMKTPGLDGPE